MWCIWWFVFLLCRLFIGIHRLRGWHGYFNLWLFQTVSPLPTLWLLCPVSKQFDESIVLCPSKNGGMVAYWNFYFLSFCLYTIQFSFLYEEFMRLDHVLIFMQMPETSKCSLWCRNFCKLLYSCVNGNNNFLIGLKHNWTTHYVHLKKNCVTHFPSIKVLSINYESFLRHSMNNLSSQTIFLLNVIFCMLDFWFRFPIASPSPLPVKKKKRKTHNSSCEE